MTVPTYLFHSYANVHALQHVLEGTDFINWFQRNRSSAHEVVDETGETLLHLAMERKAPVEVCNELLMECPAAAEFKDRTYVEAYSVHTGPPLHIYLSAYVFNRHH